MSDSRPDYHCLIVGAGFSGIGVAIKLDAEGFHDYLIVEDADDVGGTWYWNTYPGIAVDIPSFSYQFSFEQRPDWSRTYARGNELKAYADYCADKYGIRPKIRFSTKVLGVEFDEERALWRVQTDPGGEITARFVVNASGVLTVPKPPDIDGVDSFAGITMHTARWDHDEDLTGKRVAVIGTGASAVQLIPRLAPIVKELKVFQRTPIWCFPKFDVPLPRLAHWAMRLPGVRAIHRLISQAYVEVTFPIPAQYFTVYPFARWMQPLGRAYLRLKVRDPVVRAQLTPNYAIGCKRPGFHNRYLSTYNQDNVRLVTEPIDKITPSAVATRDGAAHEAGDRFPCVRLRHDADICRHRQRRPGAQEVLGREQGAGLRGRQRSRFSEPVQRDGPLRLCRVVVFRLDRGTGPPHRALPEAGPSAQRHPRRGHRGGQRPVLRRDVAPPAPAGVLAGQLPAGQQLLLRQARRRGATTCDYVRGVLAQQAFRPQRLPIRLLTDQFTCVRAGFLRCSVPRAR